MSARTRAGPEALRRLLHQHATTQSGIPIPGRVLLPPRTTLAPAVDGVWWPRSRDLQTELPTVLPSIGLKLQTLKLIHFSPADWSTHALQLPARDGAAIDLRHLTTSGLIVFTGTRVALIYALIPPDATTASAEQITTHHFRT